MEKEEIIEDLLYNGVEQNRIKTMTNKTINKTKNETMEKFKSMFRKNSNLTGTQSINKKLAFNRSNTAFGGAKNYEKSPSSILKSKHSFFKKKSNKLDYKEEIDDNSTKRNYIKNLRLAGTDLEGKKI